MDGRHAPAYARAEPSSGAPSGSRRRSFRSLCTSPPSSRPAVPRQPLPRPHRHVPATLTPPTAIARAHSSGCKGCGATMAGPLMMAPLVYRHRASIITGFRRITGSETFDGHGSSGASSVGVDTGWVGALWACSVRGTTGVARAGRGGKQQQPAVVVVESPTKAKKIQGFLGDDYKVLASYGHVRDLAERSGSVRPEDDFSMDWQLVPRATPALEEIAGAAAGSPLLLLATDPDREGEAISWHIEQELQRRGVLARVGSVRRITFTEITRAAVTAAMAGARQVSQELVDAYLARRALDYLVGFNLSPVLWRKLPGAKSAGRVQSVALRLICEREAEFERFTSRPYWSITAALEPPEAGAGPTLAARLTHVDGCRLGQLAIGSREEAEELAWRIQASPAVVARVVARELQRKPAAPFTTSTLQQEASRRLGFSAARTMQVAQQLYEGAGTGEGLITYMRTDGVQLSDEAVQELRRASESMYGKGAVPPQRRQYKSRAKNAQEAHEAIRPTRPADLPPTALPPSLDSDQRALYDLIWRRAMASQMPNAVFEVVAVEFKADGGSLTLRASGRTLREPGYLRAYDDTPAEEEEDEAAGAMGAGGDSGGSDDDAAVGREALQNQGRAAQMLRRLTAGTRLSSRVVVPAQHWTRPPPRYSEATLVRALEERGIGRPSTYAPILSLLQSRGYLLRQGRSLAPSSLGRVLTAFLERYFGAVVDYQFTSDMEERLDDVASGKAAWRQVLSSFWNPFSTAVTAVSSISTTQVFDALDSDLASYLFPTYPSATAATTAAPGLLSAGAVHKHDGAAAAATIDVTVTNAPSAAAPDPRLCPKCGRGRLVLKPSRFGGFIGCSLFADEDVKCDYSRPLLPGSVAGADSGTSSDPEGEGGLFPAANAIERLLGVHPETGEPVWVRLGPYGLYVQQGEAVKEDEAPEKAARRGAKKKAAAGMKSGADAGATQTTKPKRAAIPKANGLTIQSVTLAQALALLALPRSLGPHPEDGQPVVANVGPFGPYIAHGGVSVALGRHATPQDVDLDTAVRLLAAKRAREADREARGLPPRRRPGREAAAKQNANPVVASGYNSFRNARWREAKAANPDLSYRDALKQIGEEWRAMGALERRRFAAMAQQPAAQAPETGAPRTKGGSKGASKSKKADFAGDTRGTKGAKTVTAAAGSRSSSCSSSPSASAAAPASFRAATAVAAAATRLNPFMAFCRERRPGIKAEHPGASLGQVSRLLGEAWRALSAEEKAAYCSGGSTHPTLPAGYLGP